MNSVLGNLPRFDTDSPPRASGQFSLLLGRIPEPEPEPPVELVEEFPETEEFSEIQEEAPVEDDSTSLDELQSLVQQLSDLMENLERESREHSTHVIQVLASRLFPELSKRFLAEEIGLHLTRLVPSSVPQVDIRARSALLEQLEGIIGQNPAMAGRCKLVPTDSSDENRVEVSWKTGGVTFDFDSLLSDCLAHLDPAQTLIEE
jgi:hypothetical protein